MKIFIPEAGAYKEHFVNIPIKSVNALSEYFGYHPSKIHSYWNTKLQNSIISQVAVEVFTNNIVFIISKEDINELRSDDVEEYMACFNYQDEFPIYRVNDILQEGIENKSFDIVFLARVLNINDAEADGMYYVEKLGVYLFFIDCYLVNYQSSDGLNEWAKLWREKNPIFFKAYEDVGRHFWNNNLTNIIEEINQQAKAWADIPEASENQYIDLHKTEFGTINFLMLQVCHYNGKIDFATFSKINYGRYVKIEENSYLLDRFIYQFSNTGDLLKYSINI